MDLGRISVCIILEGSYPYITGGVSAWVQDLILGLPDIDFKLFTISPSHNQPLRYKLPKNIVEHKNIILSDKFHNQTKIKKKQKDEIRRLIIDGFRKYSDLSSFLIDLIKITPDGYSPLNDMITSDEGWALLTEDCMEKNPVYSFSDYYWAWKSSYDLLFNIIGHSLPKADIYHGISTGFAGVATLCGKFRQKKPIILTEHGLYHKEREIEIRRASFVKGNQRDMWINMYYNISKACYENADIITSLFELNRQYQIDLHETHPSFHGGYQTCLYQYH